MYLPSLLCYTVLSNNFKYFMCNSKLKGVVKKLKLFKKNNIILSTKLKCFVYVDSLFIYNFLSMYDFIFNFFSTFQIATDYFNFLNSCFHTLHRF